MKVRDIFLYMVGHREAIRRIAGSRWSLLVGALLCISAGVARHYDGRVFILEPWKLLIGVAVAVVNATIIYVFLVPMVARQHARGSRLRAVGRFYLQWLAGFLMTAPVAWLYALPVHLWLPDELAATKANVALLGVVSVVRVALVMRFAAVVTGLAWWRALVAIVLPAGVMMAAAVVFMGIQVLQVMMGLRGSPSAMWIHDVSSTIAGLCLLASIVSLFVWTICTFFPVDPSAPEVDTITRRPYAATILAALLIPAFVYAAYPTQRQLLAAETVKDVYHREGAEAVLAHLATQDPATFGRFLELPPNPYGGHGFTEVAEVYAAIDDDTPPWIREAYVARMDIIAAHPDWLLVEERVDSMATPPQHAENRHGQLIVHLLRIPEGRAWVAAHPDDMTEILANMPSTVSRMYGPPRTDIPLDVHADWVPALRDLQSLGVNLPPDLAKALWAYEPPGERWDNPSVSTPRPEDAP